ncbi:MAG: glycosyltransferase [Opitutaceae bacterium]|jgi:glycosyltransferase involved in cell wall biosynthesis|nr:glycosyltransferase [Opitutaceae bacterium]
MKLSVLLCTHNPRPAYIGRVLDALAAQAAPPDWELVVVDNRSTPPLRDWLDLSRFPGARLLHEPEAGFTPALVRAVEAAAGDVCLMLHDDNVLPPGYLAEVARIGVEWPRLGAWGGGYEPEYETAPDPAHEPFLAYLAVHPVKQERWSNALYDYGATPTGAGMAVRTHILRRYTATVRHDDRRRSLGRHAAHITSCEDFDIAFTAIDLGYGTGVFPSLMLRHLIPAGRVQRDYLVRLVEGHAYSTVLLHSFRGVPAPVARGPLAALRRWRRRHSLSPVEREVEAAYRTGELRAHAVLRRSRTAS